MTARLKIFRIRVSPGETTLFEKAARFAGLAVSTWARSRLYRIAREETEPKEGKTE